MIKHAFSLFLLLCITTVSQVSASPQDSIFDSSASSLFNNEQEFLPPDLAFNFNFEQKQQTVEITFGIVDGYYLYKKQFSFNGKNVAVNEVELPQGVEHEDEFFGIQEIYEKPLSITIALEDIGDNAQLMIRFQGCAKKGLCYPPEIKTIDLVKSTASSADIFAAMSQNTENTGDAAPVNTNASVSQSSEQHQLVALLKSESLWWTLAAFFIGGLLLSFTPCVFPMYPILTGIIVGQEKGLTTQRAFTLSFTYVQGMAVTYTLLGIVVALAGAKFQAMFQHPAVLISLSVLFIFLAFSMFGVFNLSLPASWQQKLHNLSNSQKAGSYGGVFSMGAISGLVASPCTTAPLTGALLYISQSGDITLGAAALYALSLGMGLPLLILGSSGGKLLPKAGPWMEVIKVIFGFLLLTVPVFLLERILPSSIAFALAIIILLSACAYFVKLAYKNSSFIEKLFKSSFIIVFALFFSFHLAQYYQIQSAQHTETKAFTYVNNLAELEAVVNEANANGETVMVDLYADWCVACKEFEHKTFPVPAVQKALANTRLVQIDLTDTGSPASVALMKQYDVLGLPSILFFNLAGEEISQRRVTGFMAADEFAKHIENTF
ncbi:protein-disulfide reductase DsbD [Thalassotalea sp. 1_MG-2023]|uniref:protein-disulfide reductase DsbD n=1 Tax=Thalassotalea sp. 1_MG-2023 TaxID=3062680 RepID=UPI0026E1C570|nr:protein-disulfide reductase DsbD [Thalassotalea sp. 1_MG-2023]MDO6425790.1 protein-disulfide reductase DsbD [Thalassotalea sp. 1_MG-2023]